MITPAQCRMARAALGWGIIELAKAAGVGISTVSRFEQSQVRPHVASLEAIQRALEEAGVAFTDGDEPGVKLKKARSE